MANYYLTQDSYDDFKRVIKDRLGTDLAYPSGGGTRQVCFVVPTSGHSNPWTGSAIYYDSDFNETTFDDDVLIYDINDNLKTGVSYIATRTGNTSNQAVFLVASGLGGNSSGGGSVTTSTTFLATSYTLTVNETFENTGLTLALPASGNYLLTACVQTVGVMTSFSGTNCGYFVAQLYDTTAAAVVTNSQFIVANHQVSGINIFNGSSFTVPYDAPGANTIELQIWRYGGSGAPTWTTSNVLGEDEGVPSSLTYVQG